MQAYGYLVLGPTSFDGGGGAGGGCGSSSYSTAPWSSPTPRSSIRRRFAASATVNGNRNHYGVLGVPPEASAADIKRAYRLLALKYHPDVNKEAGANEAFKSIRLAYDTLINESTRTEYDRALHFQESSRRPFADEWATNADYEDRLRSNRWAYMRRKMREEKYWEQYYHSMEENSSLDDDGNEVSEQEHSFEERESFMEVLKSVLLSIFLMHTVGIRLSLTFSSFIALTDRKLDAGYKVGYLLAWILGGRGGILLTMFLSFASWVCGKTSSSVVALVVVAMWFGSNLARFAPLPQGALLTLLYMSVKLQVDLN